MFHLPPGIEWPFTLRSEPANLPVVLAAISGKGLSESVLWEIDRALLDHELIKVRVSSEDRDDKRAAIDALLQGSGAELVQRIGHIVCLYRRHPEKPQLALPS